MSAGGPKVHRVSDSEANRRSIEAYVARVDARDWDGVDRLTRPDVVYDLPQTRETITGQEGLRAFNTAYPGDWHLGLAERYADDEAGVARLDWRVADGEDGTAIVFFRFDDAGLITRITDWWPESYEPPPGRQHLVQRY